MIVSGTPACFSLSRSSSPRAKRSIADAIIFRMSCSATLPCTSRRCPRGLRPQTAIAGGVRCRRGKGTEMGRGLLRSRNSSIWRITCTRPAAARRSWARAPSRQHHRRAADTAIADKPCPVILNNGINRPPACRVAIRGPAPNPNESESLRNSLCAVPAQRAWHAPPRRSGCCCVLADNGKHDS